jgi:hypothetical protein
MDVEKILLALEERDRWLERESELVEEIKTSPKEERAAKKEELEKIKEQVAYYDALAKDMKKSVKPTKVSHLLKTLFIYK